jgi:urea transporter
VKINQIKSVLNSIVNSYSQIFFSDGKILGVSLLLVSFFNINAGLSGVIAIIASHTTAFLLGLNRNKIISGLYGFNSLLVGLGLGLYFQFSWQLILLVVFSSVLTLFITLVTEAIFAKYSLPFLSLPFLFGIWVVSLASRHYGALELSEYGVYTYNDVVLLGGNTLLESHLSVQDLNIAESLQLYFISLGAIFFQYNIYAGIFIAIAILINSRISFLLSIIGFYAAFLYYQIIGANLGELNYGYIGFNFILTSIAIGGFFVIPSVYSFIITVLLIPILSLLVTGTTDVLGVFQLSTYSLPFNIVVISFLLVLRYRERNFRKPELVTLQKFSPEKNLYANLNFYKRFGEHLQIPIHLPFYSKWTINQSHNGKITHKDDWKHAWDFVIENEGKEYQNEGKNVEDYYCYNKPIVCPADGEIVEIIDLYDDNEIGKMDLEHNWGNSIVIKHADYLYSQISHIKLGSFKVNKGKWIKKGSVIANVGNSGRSPYPHLHFQIQATPYVGSKTIKYPIGPYISENKNGFSYTIGGIPEEKEIVSNIEADDSLKHLFKFIPGQKISWEQVNTSNSIEDNSKFEWIVGLDINNQTYLYSAKTNSYAYFLANEEELVFTSYIGSKSDSLYWFYLSSFRLIFGYYKGVNVEDDLSVSISQAKIFKLLQDFIAPFYIFIKPKFRMQYISRKRSINDSEIVLKSEFKDIVMGKVLRKIKAEFNIESTGTFVWKLDIDGVLYEFKRLRN